MKRGIIAAIACLLSLVFMLQGCAPGETPKTTQSTATETPVKTTAETTTLHTPTVTVQTDVTTPVPTETVITGVQSIPINSTQTAQTPKYDSEHTYGPYIFGTEMYSIYIGEGRIVVFNQANNEDIVNIEAPAPENLDMFLISASLIDYNFDFIPDFSYSYDDSGLRNVYIASVSEDEVKTYELDNTLSSLYNLTRNYEFGYIYGMKTPVDGTYGVYQYIEYIDDGKFTEVVDPMNPPDTTVKTVRVLTEMETLADVYEWNLETLSSAFTGEKMDIPDAVDILIRQRRCYSVDITAYLTIAYDDFGNYYIKDMIGSGYCRLMLNPDGRWSKSEKVGN